MNQTIYISPDNQGHHDEIRVLAQKNKISYFEQVVRFKNACKKDGARSAEEIVAEIGVLIDELVAIAGKKTF